MFFFYNNFFFCSYYWIWLGICFCYFYNYYYFLSYNINMLDCLSTNFLYYLFLLSSSNLFSITNLFSYFNFFWYSYLYFRFYSYSFFLFYNYIYCIFLFFYSIFFFCKCNCFINDCACRFASMSSAIYVFLWKLLRYIFYIDWRSVESYNCYFFISTISLSNFFSYDNILRFSYYIYRIRDSFMNGFEFIFIERDFLIYYIEGVALLYNWMNFDSYNCKSSNGRYVNEVLLVINGSISVSKFSSFFWL